jgi:CHAT domain-containing protein
MDVDEPGRGQLSLDDHAKDPLTVADIAALRLAGGLAFLSACERAVTTAAVALNHATPRLTERYPDWPTFWAGHIHTGP